MWRDIGPRREPVPGARFFRGFVAFATRRAALEHQAEMARRQYYYLGERTTGRPMPDNLKLPGWDSGIEASHLYPPGDTWEA